MSINFADLLANDPTFRDSINQINAAWNSNAGFKHGTTATVFVHPALKTIDWRTYGTCYGNFYDDDKHAKKSSRYSNKY